jgi:hypothetical protein
VFSVFEPVAASEPVALQEHDIVELELLALNFASVRLFVHELDYAADRVHDLNLESDMHSNRHLPRLLQNLLFLAV